MRSLLDRLQEVGASSLGLALLACNPSPPTTDSGTSDTSAGTEDSSSSDGDGDPGDGDPGDGDGDSGDGDGDGCPEGGCLDMGEPTPVNPCTEGEDCYAIDLLIVVDNSTSMVEEQVNVANNFAPLLGSLQTLTDNTGKQLDLDVHIMVTTTDIGHPLCAPPPGYLPARGEPQTVACVDRLQEFEGPDDLSLAAACQAVCPQAVTPNDPFISFYSNGNNIPNGDVSAALRCIGPQGVVGCDYSSPLEAVHLAVDPEASWNSGPNPFMRDGAVLAVLVIADGPDCSVLAPEGYGFFNNAMMNTFWEFNPDTATKTRSTPAVCWNAGVNCEGLQNGAYADCNVVDFGALHPIERYRARLEDELSASVPKQVMFLGVLGVPPVTQHDVEPPYAPIAGGVDELVYRHWVDGTYPMGDLLPDSTTDAAHLEWMLGIGPGCTGEDGMGGFAGQALPPVRIKELCQSLDGDGQVRCCIESVCDTNYSSVIDCLSPP